MSRARPRVLLVEDDHPLRASIARGLGEAGYQVTEAATGPEALAVAQTQGYEAFILDILLPGMRGDLLCEKLRLAGIRSPILMLTALDEVDQRIAGLDAGADDYLTKPFDFGELLARLRALLRRSRATLSPRVTVGDLTIDTLRRSVRRGTREILLTAKEYEFLLCLARHAGRVVSRVELVQEVWGGEAVLSNIIDVYVSRLRRKVDEGERVPLLATQRGAGFLLETPSQTRRSRTGTRG